jgi:S-formylglutathione hydrolase
MWTWLNSKTGRVLTLRNAVFARRTWLLTMAALGFAAGLPVPVNGAATEDGESPGLTRELVTSTLETRLVPSPVTFSVLLPPSYEEEGDRTYPLLLWLHGGSGDHRYLRGSAPTFARMWSEGTLPEMVVVTPTATQTQYMDYRDGSEQWESFIMMELLPHVRANHRVSTEHGGTFVAGVSMGGRGALTLGFRHLDAFGVIVAYEPYVDPAYEWEDARPTSMFYKLGDPVDKFGDPIDSAYWEAHNPATIVRNHADEIRASGIQIYIEVGSEDVLGLHRGANFLHQALYEYDIRHEYRYVAGADHVGATFAWRTPDGLAFLNRAINPPPHDPQVEGFRKWADAFKRRVGFFD